MAVEDAETPRTENQKRGSGKKDPHELNRQLPLLASESWSNRIDEQWRRKDTQQNENRSNECKSADDGACYTAGLNILLSGQEP